ncbi:MAG: hypothetical protein ACREO4_16515, partial [Lysobacter sp.]
MPVPHVVGGIGKNLRRERRAADGAIGLDRERTLHLDERDFGEIGVEPDAKPEIDLARLDNRMARIVPELGKFEFERR